MDVFIEAVDRPAVASTNDEPHTPTAKVTAQSSQ
jgi:hypothetical protein